MINDLLVQEMLFKNINAYMFHPIKFHTVYVLCLPFHKMASTFTSCPHPNMAKI